MARHPKPDPKPDNPEEYERFLKTARELEADESPDALDKAFDRIVTKRPPPKKPGTALPS